jgi:hypothetical protein
VCTASMSLRPSSRSPPGSRNRKPEEPRHSGRDGRVVLVEADAEAGIAEVSVERQRALQRLLDAFAVSGCGEVLLPLHAPRHAGAIRRAKVEPGLGGLRLAGGPLLGRGDRDRDAALELLARLVSSGLIRNPPPRRGRIEHLAGLAGRRPARRGQGGLHAVESRVQDLRVNSRELFAAAQRAGTRAGRRRRQQRAGERRRRRVPCQAHNALVFRRCFSACRSRAS